MLRTYPQIIIGSRDTVDFEMHTCSFQLVLYFRITLLRDFSELRTKLTKVKLGTTMTVIIEMISMEVHVVHEA